jgi:hypothetical protein
MLRTALALAQRKLHVFPCVECAKEPAVAGGCRAATADPLIIRQWWGERPDCNIGVATGAISGIFALDIDDGVNGEAELRRLEAEHDHQLPPSVEVITGSGRHIYFRMPAVPVRNSAGMIAPGIDIRGDGGYCIAPPSLHPTGRRYRWSVDSANSFAAAPDWLLKLVCSPARSTSAPTLPSEWRVLVQGVGEGARNSSLTRLAGYLLRHSIDPYVVSELLHVFNIERCRPPLPAEDVERIVGSIVSRELKRRGAV